MYQNTFSDAHCLIDKVKRFLQNVVPRIEYNLPGVTPRGCAGGPYLFIILKPAVSQVEYSYGLPVIRDLLSSAVDYMRDLIRDNELQILN